MSNVVDFATRREASVLGNKVIVLPLTRGEYLQVAKDALVREDYEYLLCAIMDIEYYDLVEEPIRKIVDSYYTFDN